MRAFLIGSALSLSTVFLLGVGLELGARWCFPEGYFHWRPIPDVHVTHEFRYQILRNSWHMRDREYSTEDLAKPTLLMLGDSLTFGMGVASENTFSKVLENKLGDTWLVANAGGEGTGTLSQFNFLKNDFFPRHRPSRVAICFYLGNDSDNNRQEISQGHQASAASAPTQASPQSWLLDHSAFFNFGYLNIKRAAYHAQWIRHFQGKEQLRREDPPEYREGWRATEDIIQRIHVWFQERPQMQLFFVMLPQDFQVDAQKQQSYGLNPEEYDHLKPNRLLARILDDRQIPYLDTTPAFTQHYQQHPEDKLFFPVDRHPNENGHRLIAEEIYRFMQADKLGS
jgi:lysophospholipase L1-like esterase